MNTFRLFLLTLLFGSSALVAEPVATEDLLRDMPAEQWLSTTIAVYPLIQALMAAGSFLGATANECIPVNPIQEGFLQKFMPVGTKYATVCKQLSPFADSELRAWGSSNAKDINTQLLRYGYSIQLNQLPGEGIYVASIMDVLVTWREEGFATKLRAGELFYDAVSMSKHCITYQAAEHQHPVFGLLTKGKDVVYMTKAPERLSNFALLQRTMALEKSLKVVRDAYNELIFPMVDLEEKGDISWLQGMRLDKGAEWFVKQALQETKFKMNQHGARAQSAVAISVDRLSTEKFEPPKIYLMDEPFYCWISRPGLKRPLFAGYIAPEVWRNPGKIADETVDEMTKGVPLGVGLL